MIILPPLWRENERHAPPPPRSPSRSRQTPSGATEAEIKAKASLLIGVHFIVAGRSGSPAGQRQNRAWREAGAAAKYGSYDSLSRELKCIPTAPPPSFAMAARRALNYTHGWAGEFLFKRNCSSIIFQ